MSDHFPPLFATREEESEAIIESVQSDMDAPADALLGTEFRDAETVRTLSRLGWLRSLLTTCGRHEDTLGEDDPLAYREMIAEVESLLHDAEAVLTRLGHLPEAERPVPGPRPTPAEDGEVPF